MQIQRTVFSAVGVVALLTGATLVEAADTFRKLTGPEIRARLPGMEITDEAHWAHQYMADGSVKTFSMGRSQVGKWQVKGAELCVEYPKEELECSEVWLSGKEVEFRQPGRSYNFEGVLQKQTPRS